MSQDTPQLALVVLGLVSLGRVGMAFREIRVGASRTS